MTSHSTFSTATLLRMAAESGWSMEAIASLEDLLQRWQGASIASPPPASEPTSAVLPTEKTDVQNRYRTVETIGQGGMGRVVHVFDEKLRRDLALKTVLPTSDRSRFISEALVTAQLQHSGILPIYDLEQTDPLSPSYTMPLVEGQTFELMILKHHRSLSDSGEAALHHLVELLRRVGEVMRYAHSKGVVHRDLKPSNIMVGTFGEIYVIDWGLAKRVGDSTASTSDDPLSLEEEATSSENTGMHGSPEYMAPEQAILGAAISERTDCYALGGCLYFILTGKPPRDGRAEAIIRLLRGPHQPPPPLPSALSHGLGALCQNALFWEPSERPSTDEFVQGLTAWLDGSHRRKQAQRLVQEALELRAEMLPLQALATRLNSEAAQALNALAPWEPTSAKEAAWLLESQATEALAHSESLSAEALHKLDAALQLEPTHALARDLMSDHYRRLHQHALLQHDRVEARRLELQVRAFGADRHADYLKGEGRLTLYTQPEGALVELFAYEEVSKRLRPRLRTSLGHTPLVDIGIPAGSYLLRLSGEGIHPTLFPIQIRWNEAWNGAAPDELSPHTIFLPPQGSIGSDESYVPAGYFQAGEKLKWVWIDGFVIKRHPVTNAQFIQFLNALVEEGANPVTLLQAPRERSARPEKLGELLYGWDPAQRSFTLEKDAQGHQWMPDHPVVMIPHWAAICYCQWLSQKEGYEWRLPFELEWEKAARGVDGRLFPWGNQVDHSFAGYQHSRPPGEDETPDFVSEDRFSTDESPYGVRGMAGNVSDWCLDAALSPHPNIKSGRIDPIHLPPPHGRPDTETERILRGGHWYSPARELTWRFPVAPLDRLPSTGFRPVRPLDLSEKSSIRSTMRST